MASKRTTRIHYENHALSRMMERGVDKASVERAIADPDWTAPGDKDGRIKIAKRINKKTCIHVVIERHPKFIRVISAWWVHE